MELRGAAACQRRLISPRPRSLAEQPIVRKKTKKRGGDGRHARKATWRTHRIKKLVDCWRSTERSEALAVDVTVETLVGPTAKCRDADLIVA